MTGGRGANGGGRGGPVGGGGAKVGGGGADVGGGGAEDGGAVRVVDARPDGLRIPGGGGGFLPIGGGGPFIIEADDAGLGVKLPRFLRRFATEGVGFGASEGI